MRDKPIDETKYTELVSDFKNTIEEVYKILKSKFKIGRVRLLKEPRSTLLAQRS